MSTVYIKLRDNLKKGDGIIIHNKNGEEVTLIKWSKCESAECDESSAKSYVANYGHLLEIVTPEDLSKQVEYMTAFLKKKFPKEFKPGKQVEEEERNTGVGEESEVEESTEDSESNSETAEEESTEDPSKAKKAKKAS